MWDWVVATFAAAVLFGLILWLVHMGLPILMWIVYG